MTEKIEWTSEYISLQKKKDALVQLASKFFNIPVDELLTTREYPCCQIRFAIFKLLRNEGYSFPAIGKVFNKSHSTVIFGINRVDDAIAINGSDPNQKNIYEILNERNTIPEMTHSIQSLMVNSARLNESLDSIDKLCIKNRY